MEEALSERVSAALDALDPQSIDYAASQEDWHAAAAFLFKHAHLLGTDAARAARLVRRPWARPRGGVANRRRDEEMEALLSWYLIERGHEKEALFAEWRRAISAGALTREAYEGLHQDMQARLEEVNVRLREQVFADLRKHFTEMKDDAFRKAVARVAPRALPKGQKGWQHPARRRK